MRKLALALSITLIAFTVSACKPGEVATKVLDGIEDVANAVQTSVGYAKMVAKRYCGEVGASLAMTNQVVTSVGASCKAKNEVSRIASGVASYCNNIDNIAEGDILGLIGTVRKARDDARKVVAAGC
jgi:hypothetical protein